MTPTTLDRQSYETTTSKKYGESIDVTVIPESEYVGYTFSGWATEDATIENGKFTMPAKDVVLVGSFTADLNTYKVQHWLENLSGDTTGEQGPDGKYYTLQTADTEVHTDRRSGALVEAIPKAYTGFSARVDNVLTGHVAGDGNLVLNVYYDRHMRKVTYIYFDDGNLPDNKPDIPTSYNKIDVPYGTKLEVEAKLELDGYIFDGWHTSTATVTEEDGKKIYNMPDHDVIFWARYQNKHLVKYDLNGGTGASGVDYSEKEVADGTLITVNAAPRKSGYSFNGWLADDTTYQSGDTHTVNEEITFVAQWKRNGGGGGGGTTNYTLTYDTNGGTELKKETYASGTKVKLDKVTEKEGYKFDGWYLDKPLTEKAETVTMTKHITVYAKWTKDGGTTPGGSTPGGEDAPTHPVPGGLNGEEHFAYVVGYPDGTVKPDANITRAEVAAIFFRLLKDSTREENLSSQNVFTDVSESEWYNAPISTLAKLGILEGRSAKKFEPNANITRSEFAAIAARFDDSEVVISDSFTDITGHWAEDEIHEAAAYGWIKGYDDNSFRPDKPITRAEAMTLINRVLNRVPENINDLLDAMTKWPDNANTSMWYYIAVQEATNSHEYKVKGNRYETWIELKENRNWLAYED